jgi:hypothetical protein
MFLHIFYTWIVANLLHPVFIFLGFYIVDGYPIFTGEGLQFFFPALMYSLLFSIPCLFIGWLCLYLVSITPFHNDTKFLMWLFVAPLLVFMEILVILLLEGNVDVEELVFALPGIGAVAVAILSRYVQFQNLNNIDETTNHETDLV